MSEREPNLVTSSLSRRVTWNGNILQLEIYRLEDEADWTLEVGNEAGTSTVRDDPFPSDDAAEAEFRATLKRDGIAAFQDNVIAFQGRRH